MFMFGSKSPRRSDSSKWGEMGEKEWDGDWWIRKFKERSPAIYKFLRAVATCFGGAWRT